MSVPFKYCFSIKHFFWEKSGALIRERRPLNQKGDSKRGLSNHVKSKGGLDANWREALFRLNTVFTNY